ncbi:MAG: hypothetical protein HC881_06720 [Leptolyngbyaceae cyanobacterium SL_7_1]|nr:hypothetical protein [Leptolyngbyaceae cyanobacterium SL_7_1]
MSFLQPPAAPAAFLEDLEGLNLLDLELERSPSPPTAFPPVEEDLTLPQFDPATPVPNLAQNLAQSDDDNAIFQLDEPITAIQSDLSDLEELTTIPGLAEEEVVFDSAALLDQLTAASPPSTTPVDAPAVPTADEEMDELYESLFGVTTGTPLVEPTPTELLMAEENGSYPIAPDSSAPDSNAPDLNAPDSNAMVTPIESPLGEMELVAPLDVSPLDTSEGALPTEAASWETAAQSLETFLFDGEQRWSLTQSQRN